MYKVLVVDDELPAREMIGYLVDWEDTDFYICDYARDGEEAFEKYITHKPDLIITDIQMPVMDGIEFIKKVRKIDKHQKFAILSCHEKFQYVKMALKMGVEDYLLKDLLSSEDLYSLLNKVKVDLKEDEKNIEKSSDVKEKDYYEEIVKLTTLKKIIFSELSNESMEEYIDKLDLNLISGVYVILFFEIDEIPKTYSVNEIMDLRRRILSGIKKGLADHYDGEIYPHGENGFIVITQFKKNNSKQKYFDAIYKIINSIRKYTTNSNEVTATIGISKEFYNLKDIKENFEQSRDVVKLKIFLGKNQNLFHNTMFKKTTNTDKEKVDKSLTEIRRLIENGMEKETLRYIDILYERDLKGYLQYNYLMYVNNRLFGYLRDFIYYYELSFEMIFEKNYVSFDEVQNMNSIIDMKTWYINHFEKIFECLDKKTQRYSKRVYDAIKYMETHYGEDISLEDIADVCGVHKVYISRHFKEETKCTVSKYLLNYRVEKAKELLKNTNLKNIEIAIETGFKNSQLFSMNFKKITEMTPSEYRRSKT